MSRSVSGKSHNATQFKNPEEIVSGHHPTFTYIHSSSSILPYLLYSFCLTLIASTDLLSSVYMSKIWGKLRRSRTNPLTNPRAASSTISLASPVRKGRFSSLFRRRNASSDGPSLIAISNSIGYDYDQQDKDGEGCLQLSDLVEREEDGNDLAWIVLNSPMRFLLKLDYIQLLDQMDPKDLQKAVDTVYAVSIPGCLFLVSDLGAPSRKSNMPKATKLNQRNYF